MFNKQKGFTAFELLAVIAFVSFWGAIIWVAFHFIAKFW